MRYAPSQRFAGSAEILASISLYEKRLSQARADLAHVTACIAIFEASSPGEDVSSYVDTHRMFARGEMVRLCKEALASGPKTTKELALHVMASKASIPATRCWRTLWRKG